MSKNTTQVIEVLRRLYHDIIVRRSRVRIEVAKEINHVFSPIFIIGVYRSGTTLLRYIIDSHKNIACPPESDFISVLSLLTENKKYSLRFNNMGYDENHVLIKLREFCNYFFYNYARSHNKNRWADKSPLYVDHLDFLVKLFPDAQFIIIYRHGFDQSDSFTRGGTLIRDQFKKYLKKDEDLRIGAIRYWKEKVDKLIRFEENNKDICFSIKYEELCKQPEKHLRSMFRFIKEEWDENIYNYYHLPHDKGAEDGRVIATREISVRESRYIQWSNELKEKCYLVSKNTIKKLNYHI